MLTPIGRRKRVVEAGTSGEQGEMHGVEVAGDLLAEVIKGRDGDGEGRADRNARRRLEAKVGRVATRGTGGSAARWISPISTSSAACRLRSWVRNRCAVISTSPCWVTRRPASARRRVCISAGSPDNAGSNRNCTAVATLLTFCPPGPDARTKLSTTDLSSMAMPGVTGITPSRRNPCGDQPRLRRPAARFAGLAAFRPSPIFLASAERVFA